MKCRLAMALKLAWTVCVLLGVSCASEPSPNAVKPGTWGLQNSTPPPPTKPDVESSDTSSSVVSKPSSAPAQASAPVAAPAPVPAKVLPPPKPEPSVLSARETASSTSAAPEKTAVPKSAEKKRPTRPADRAASNPKPVVPPPPKSNLPATVESNGNLLRIGSDMRGLIQTVNQPSRYVVLSFPLGVMPSKDVFLDVVRQGLKVGELRVSGPQKENLTVADILVGECQVGDEVRAQENK